MEIQELKNGLAKELMSKSKDTAIDVLEIGLDAKLTNEVLKQLPGLKILATLWEVGLCINDRFFCNKLTKFIIELQNDEIDENERLEFKNKMEEESYKNKVTEKLMIIIDRLDDENKTIYLEKLFKGFIEKKIEWNDFCNFSKYINLMVAEDFELLKFLGSKGADGENISDSEKRELEGNANKLMNFNFLQVRFIVATSVGISPVTSIHSITNDGFKFLSCIS